MALPDLAQIQRALDAVAAADAAFEAADDTGALRMYTALTAGGSRFAYGSYRAGLVLLRTGQLAKAIARFSEAADLGHSLAMVELARLVAAGDPAAAWSWLLRAAESGYRDARAVAREPRLRELLVNREHAHELAQRMQPAQHDERRRKFDFWLGDWDVRASDGRPAGRNRIRSLLGGALIHEDWISVLGWRGQSINFLNTERGEWEQLWVQDDGSLTHYTRGRFRRGTLTFRTGRGNGARKLSFQPLSNGWVRQVGEGRAADGGWIVEYDLIYVPRP